MQEAHELTYWRGRLYDAQTGRRVEFAPGTPVLVVVRPGRVLPPPPAAPPLRRREAQEAELRRTCRFFEHVAARGTELQVKIPGSRELGEAPLLLRVRLLEDLYFYDRPDRSRAHGSEFFACQCEVIGDHSGQMPDYAYPHGLSLNDLYKNAYLAFRQDGGNPSCNAAEEFLWEDRPGQWTNFMARKRTFEAELKRRYPLPPEPLPLPFP